KSLKAQGFFTVILALHEPSSDKSIAWITRLPFPVQLWTRFGSHEVERLREHTMSDTKVIVLVPVSTEHQRIAIIKKLRRHITFLSLVRLVFVLEPGEVLPYEDFPD
ncbi:unnamed protein product, partial [Ixodes hexagonus]